MNRVPITLLLLTTWLAVFGQTQFPTLFGDLGMPLDIRPALIVYAALTHGLPTVLGIAASRQRAEALADEAELAAAALGPQAAELAALARWIITRNH